MKRTVALGIMALTALGIMALLVIALVPFVSGWNGEWEATCIGDILVENSTLTVDGDVIPITRNTTCSFGCDSGRRICTDFSGPPGAAVPFALFIIIELIALGLLATSFMSPIAIYKLLSSLMALILLFSLGLLANNIMTDTGAVTIEWLGWLNIGLAWVGVVMFLASIFFVLKEATSDKLSV